MHVLYTKKLKYNETPTYDKANRPGQEHLW